MPPHVQTFCYIPTTCLFALWFGTLLLAILKIHATLLTPTHATVHKIKNEVCQHEIRVYSNILK